MNSTGKWIRWVYRIVIIVVWIGAIGWLRNTYYAKDRQKTTYMSLDTGLVEVTDETEWMDILLNGQKIGYGFTSTQSTDRHEIAMNSFMQLNMVVAGFPTTITTQSRAKMDSLYHLKSFNFFLNSDRFSTHFVGKRNGDVLKVQMINGKDSTEFDYPAPANLTPSLAIKPLIVHHGIKPGDAWTVPVYEPMSQTMVDVHIEHEGKQMISWDSTQVEVNKLKIEYNGFPSILYVDDNGLTYREESMMGLVLQRATGKPDMTSIGHSNIDLAGFYSVPLIGTMPPAPVKDLTVRINGLSPKLLPDSPIWEHLVSPKDSTVFAFHSGPKLTTPPDSGALSGNAIIQARRPEIRNLAISITKQEATVESRVQSLLNFVYTDLEKVPVANLTSAMEILTQKRGDCSEHTTLFTSLSRSIGIPTRVNIGIVFVNGIFMYHAWPSVYMNGSWLDIDPTLNQYPADATHIALLESDMQNLTELIPVLGRISITRLNSKSAHANS